jgi:hypothetical protein
LLAWARGGGDNWLRVRQPSESGALFYFTFAGVQLLSGANQMVKQFFVVFALACLWGCIASAADDAKVVQSKDKRIQITLPDGWESTSLPGITDRWIQAKSTDKTAFVIVLSEAKGDLKIKSVKEYMDVIMKAQRGKKILEDRTESEPKKLKINGADAIQLEVRGTSKNVNLAYLETFIEFQNRWCHVTTWTVPSNWDECQADFRAIYESLKEVPKSP